MYNSISPSAQTAIETCISPLVRSMSQNKAASQRLIELVHTAPEGSENLVLKVLMIMTELVKPSIKLIETVKHVVAEKKLDMQFIAPIMAGLEREEVMVYLPKLFLMLDGTLGRKSVVAEILVRLTAIDMNSGKAAIDAVDILVEVNNMDSQIGLKKCLEGMHLVFNIRLVMNLCFEMPSVFEQDVLSSALERLIEQPKLPTLFMRTVIQSLKLYTGLQGAVITILSKLVGRKIWSNIQLWKGFILCVKETVPKSYHVLITLPPAQIEDLVKRAPPLKNGIQQYLENLSAAQRNSSRIQAITNVMK